MTEETKPVPAEPIPEPERGGSDLQGWIMVGVCAAACAAIVLLYRDHLERCRKEAKESAERMEALAVDELRKRQAAETANSKRPKAAPAEPAAAPAPDAA